MMLLVYIVFISLETDPLSNQPLVMCNVRLSCFLRLFFKPPFLVMKK